MNKKQILTELNKKVIGHLEAKKALICLFQRSEIRFYQKYISLIDDNDLIEPMKILLIGPSGSGKTLMVNTIKKLVDCPMVMIDANQLNPTGAGGGITTEDLQRQIKLNAAKLMKEHPDKYFSLDGVIDRTVVYIDEIDKISSSYNGNANSHWNEHVQSNFLNLFDNKAEFSGVSFIFSGAFSGIDKQKNVKGSIGFSKTADSVIDNSNIDEEIVKYGLLPELVGRLTSIVSLDRFTKDNYIHILKTVLIPKKELDLVAFNVYDNIFTKATIEELAEKAYKSGQGVRFLKRELDKRFMEMEFDSNADELYYL